MQLVGVATGFCGQREGEALAHRGAERTDVECRVAAFGVMYNSHVIELITWGGDRGAARHDPDRRSGG